MVILRSQVVEIGTPSCIMALKHCACMLFGFVHFHASMRNFKPMEYSVRENADLHLGQVGQIMV